jgi:hypothetical protein
MIKIPSCNKNCNTYCTCRNCAVYEWDRLAGYSFKEQGKDVGIIINTARCIIMTTAFIKFRISPVMAKRPPVISRVMRNLPPRLRSEFFRSNVSLLSL